MDPNGYLDTVRVLVEAGANKNQVTKIGVALLHIAAAGGYLEVVRALIESGADVDLITKDERTAWDLASMNGHQEVVHELGAKRPMMSMMSHATMCRVT